MRPSVKHAPVCGHHKSLTRKPKAPNWGGGGRKGGRGKNIMKACLNIKINFNSCSADSQQMAAI